MGSCFSRCSRSWSVSIEEWKNVRVLEIRRRLDLGQKALRADDGRQLGLQNLEGDFPLVPEVVGQIDGGHAALPELALDPVAAFEGPVEEADGILHSESGTRRLQEKCSIQFGHWAI
jgi:hypothetical protein